MISAEGTKMLWRIHAQEIFKKLKFIEEKENEEY
jgi:hypothetical protein